MNWAEHFDIHLLKYLSKSEISQSLTSTENSFTIQSNMECVCFGIKIMSLK